LGSDQLGLVALVDSSILLILLQDGVTNGAVYALLALSLVLVFSVTRVIFLPQGEFVSYGALTLASLEAGQLPGTAWLLLGMGGLAFVSGAAYGRHTMTGRAVALLAAETLLLPLAVFWLAYWLAPLKPGLFVKTALALAIVIPMGPYIYRIVYSPISSASVLVLLIASVGLHLLMTGLGLIFFGAEGSRTPAFSDASVTLGPLYVTGQSLAILVTAFVLIAGLFLFFGRTLLGKALRATAVNQLGAQLSGISPLFAGRTAFAIAAFCGALSGILIAPVTTIYYDTGFMIGLKGFVGAIVAGLASYPVAAAAAIFVGIVESFASFWASEFKEVIVFTVIIPVLLWRSWRSPATVEEGEEAISGASSSGSLWAGRIFVIAAAAFILGLPLIPGVPPFWITLLNYAGIYSIVTIGLVVLTGAAGITSFGQALFVGLGAYTTALLTAKAGISPWLSLPAALAITGLAAWLIGAITLRLSGHYLPVATLAWNICFFYIAVNFDFLGRNDGLSGLPPIVFAGFPLLGSSEIYYLIWALLALSALLTANLLSSRTGRAIRALNGGALAAEAFGIEVGGVKILAFVYAAMLAALAGWLYAHLQRAVNPTPFGLNASIEYLLMAVAGGAGYIFGAIGGSVVILVLKDQLQNVLPKLLGAQLNFESVVFGAVLILILQTAREGLWPHIARLVPALGPRVPHYDPAAPAPSHEERVLAAGPILQVKDLSKNFGGLAATNCINFELQKGEITGLIGPNGAGKSTTFNLITGILAPSAGEIHFNGRRIDWLPPHAIAKLGIGRTFQHVKLVPGMSVIENVALGAHLRGKAGAIQGAFRLSGPEEARLFGEAARQLKRVGLADEAGRQAVTLSLGQQRIVEIARALCMDPALLLLDEPAAGLRHFEKEQLASLLADLREEGMAILLVEHDMDFVMGLADHLIVMNFGSKLAEGPPAMIQNEPAVLEAYLGSA
jgi:ABC-type branched-subunit amino acid transport system ATPase component/branched-subunit amino acid ABC-type transport system permease component